MSLLRSFALLALALPAAIMPALAEGNRVLPFWAQPYPAGYTQHEAGTFAPERRCRVPRRVHTRHGLRTVFVDRCRPVLHARD